MGDGEWVASALARKGWATATRSEPVGRRRVRPVGSQASFLPERRRSWT